MSNTPEITSPQKKKKYEEWVSNHCYHEVRKEKDTQFYEDNKKSYQKKRESLENYLMKKTNKKQKKKKKIDTKSIWMPKI